MISDACPLTAASAREIEQLTATTCCQKCKCASCTARKRTFTKSSTVVISVFEQS